MGKDYLLESDRLGFRNWKEEDLSPFKKMNQSADVMHYFPSTLSSRETEALYNRIKGHFEQHGYGFYAVDELKSGSWIGFIGFQHVRFKADFTPAVEIGYRLLPEYWGKGMCSEGSLACLDHANDHLDFDQVVSFTAKINLPSQRVIQKIGLSFQYEFDHPLLKKDDPLLRHVLYQKSLK